MPTIDLDRRFVEWNDEEKAVDPDVMAEYGFGQLTWQQLGERRRVVVLAEAGSGKTEELKAEARRHTAAGQFAIYAKLQDVGRNGLQRSLRYADQSRLAAWMASDQPGWLFIDSVDEAKLDGVQLQQALRELANAVRGAEARAHVVISGRHTDWEFKRDLATLVEELPIPPDAPAPAPPDPDDILISTLRRERREERAPPEIPLVAVMTALDKQRVRAFAQGKGVRELDSLLAAIEAGNLWRFARRPLDLEWLVNFWSANSRLGTLAEMLQASLEARSDEPDDARARLNPLDRVRVEQALERIGAALVLGRRDTIAIPDGEANFDVGSNPPLNLYDVLPDWGPQDIARLLARPVFDPATFGRARLHNDNEGVVRAYLAAKWIKRLRASNLSTREMLALLFGERYGVEVTKPSMRETAAWLAIEEPLVAGELSKRDAWVLLGHGDPASLPATAVADALARVAEQLGADIEPGNLSFYGGTLRLAARGDVAETVNILWNRHHQVKVREFLLQLVFFGELRACADLAVSNAMDPLGDRSIQRAAGLALTVTADDSEKRRYGEYVVANVADIDPHVAWSCVRALFPAQMNVDQFMSVISATNAPRARDGFRWSAGVLVDRVASRADLEKLLGHLLAIVGPKNGDHDQEAAYLPAIATASYRLLEMCPAGEAPVSAIDGVLRLGEDRRRPRDEGKDPGELLQASAARRRIALWRIAEFYRGHGDVPGGHITELWQIEMLGWVPRLSMEGDLDWLLADVAGRESATDKLLATNLALEVWREAGSQPGPLERIEAAARNHDAASEAYDAWFRPNVPSQAYIESRERREEQGRRNRLAAVAVNRSWIEFANRLRSDPAQLRGFRAPSAEGIDARLYHLWQLLTSYDHSRYAVDTVASLQPIFGPEVVNEFADALKRHWRQWRPLLKHERAPEDLNSIRAQDCVGLVGVSLEAAADRRWASGLSSEEASLAARYAMHELNGFPTWLPGLALERPDEVRDVIVAEVTYDLDHAAVTGHSITLQHLAYADQQVVDLVCPALLAELERRTSLPGRTLTQIIELLVQGRFAGREELAKVALRRCAETTDLNAAGHYLGAVFAIDVPAATAALALRLDNLGADDQSNFAQAVLPLIFGSGHSRLLVTGAIDVGNLARLVRLAFRTIRPDEDLVHPEMVAHSVGDRDRAEEARRIAFNRLTETPGAPTYATLLQLAGEQDFHMLPSRLEALARERAAQDADEQEPWKAGEALAFEGTHQTAPRTPRDLLVLARHRIADIQHDLLHDDFAQGATLSGLPDEAAVQTWVADRLRLLAGRAYSVERESHVVDEKEPDIRLRARASDASVPIEIKVAESWTVEELEVALRQQLCRQYLRARGARHGLLLLVHKEPRPRGWRNTDGSGFLSFTQLVTRLRALAADIARSEPGAPEPEVIVLDVSNCAAANDAGTPSAEATETG